MSPIASNSEDGIWETLPWQVGIALVVSDLDISDVGIQKPTQRGISNILLAFALYEACFRKRNVGNWQPRDKDAKTFGNRHVGPAIDVMPEVANKLITRRHKDPNNSVQFRGFQDAYFQVSPAQKDQDFRADSIATAEIDEADGMPLRVQKGEGNERGSSPFELVKGRMDAEDYPKCVVVSTPRVQGSSNIENYLSELEVVLNWYLPCPQCDRHQRPVWGDAAETGAHGVIWDEVHADSALDEHRSGLTARYRCEFCDTEFDFQQILEQNEQGYWASDTVKLVTEPYGWVDPEWNKPVEKPISVGFQFPGFFSGTNKALSNGVTGWLRALRHKRLGDDRAWIRWKNEYESVTVDQSTGAMRIDGKSLLSYREDFDQIPNEVQYVVGFWDLNNRRGSMGMFCGFGAGMECWILEFHHLKGSPTEHRQEIWSITERHRQRVNERKIEVSACMVDTGDMITEVRLICDRNPVLYIPTKGSSIRGKNAFEWSGNNKHSEESLGMIGTDTLKKLIFTRLQQDRDERVGKIHIPIGEDFNLVFLEGLVGEELVHVWRDGKNPVEEWHRVSEGIWNEPLDTFVGCYAAIDYLEAEFGFCLLDEPIVETEDDEPYPPENTPNLIRQDSDDLIEKYSEASDLDEYDASSLRDKYRT